MNDRYKKYKLYNNSLGYYFNLNNRRYYLHNFLRVENDEYNGYFGISNCLGLAIKLIDDESIAVRKIII